MKKSKILGVSLAILPIATAFCPLVVLSSCGQEKSPLIYPTNAIPYDQLVVRGGKLFGLKEKVDLSKYNTLYIDPTITEIGENAFTDAFNGVNNPTITRIVFAQNTALTKIGAYAFEGCSALANSLQIPANVTNIARFAFKGCNHIQVLKLNTHKVVIEQGAFDNCQGISVLDLTNLTSVPTMENWFVTLKNWDPTKAAQLPGCFSNWNETRGGLILHNFTAQQQIEDFTKLLLGSDDHNGCLNGVTSYSVHQPIPSKYLDIDRKGVLKGFTTDTKTDDLAKYRVLNIPDNVTKIEQYAFTAQDSRATKIPANVNYLTFSAAGNLKEICDYAFENCNTFKSLANADSLEALILPEGLERLGNSVFSGCFHNDDATTEPTATLTLPGSLNKIGLWAFNGCNKFKSIDLTGYMNLPSWAWQDKSNIFTNWYSGDNVDLFFNIPWFTKNHFPNLYRFIFGIWQRDLGEKWFANVCQKIGYLDTENIPYEWYYHDDKGNYTGLLDDINIEYCTKAFFEVSPEDAPYKYKFNSVGGFADTFTLARNSQIKYINFVGDAQSPMSILPNAFTHCNALEGKSSDLSEAIQFFNVKSIGHNAFYDCNNIQSPLAFNDENVEAKITEIGDYAFANCHKIPSFTSNQATASLTKIGKYAFANDTAFQGGKNGEVFGLEFGQDLKEIGEGAFMNTNLNGTLNFQCKANTKICKNAFNIARSFVSQAFFNFHQIVDVPTNWEDNVFGQEAPEGLIIHFPQSVPSETRPIIRAYFTEKQGFRNAEAQIQFTL